MPTPITMPQLSDTMSEGTVVKWHKKEGDKVKAGEEIADVETDKAVMPMEAFESGTLAHIATPEGSKVGVGQAIAYLATGKEDPAEVKKQVAGAGAAKSAPQSAGVPASAGMSSQSAPKAQVAEKQSGAQRVPPPAPHAGSVATIEGASYGEIHEPDEVGHHATRERPTPVPAVPAHGRNGDGARRLIASPLAKRIAADKGIDLSQVEGSGPNGRIVKQDVLNAAERKPQELRRSTDQPQRVEARSLAPQPVPVLAARVEAGHTEVLPLSKIRSVIAQRLQQSKQTIPHFYETMDCDVEDLAKLRERLNKQLEHEKVRLSLGDLVAKAIATALVMNPALNATFNGKDEVTRYGDVNLGMAVALPDGLIVPVLRGVNHMGFREIRIRSADLIERARAQRLKQEELSGATFTVSNLGSMGVREFSAIINPPEVGILAVGAAEKRAVVKGEQIVARTMMTVTLSADHRVVDGAVAAEFLRTLKQLLEEPGLMLV